ncbi:cell wall hydrolase [Cereibacter azotoformans]|uniref:cell wall hydrolase n=1 Tax=Cereibacter azotoformans TaxID=43057 RepID=UPI001EE9CAE1|nr:cell wall hydrolase [Cereibacter azotoformans]ULB09167.1 cell wall hydrolase [Cereibacter azotoformans]
MSLPRARLTIAVCLGLTALLGACGRSPQECMERAMYFESNRSSRDGMVAVGSVVMNRVESGQYPRSVCGVVGQRGQFAPGIMSRRMESRALPLVRDTARSVLRGERHPMIGNAMFFHTAGHRFPYDNMHYVLVTGGNAFYERRPSALVTQPVPPQPMEGLTGWRGW